jgi:hypothetical protein
MENNQLEGLEQLYHAEIQPNIRQKIADVMLAYGVVSIPYLMNCANTEIQPENREYIYTKIKELKRK